MEDMAKTQHAKGAEPGCTEGMAHTHHMEDMAKPRCMEDMAKTQRTEDAEPQCTEGLARHRRTEDMAKPRRTKGMAQRARKPTGIKKRPASARALAVVEARRRARYALGCHLDSEEELTIDDDESAAAQPSSSAESEG